MVTMVGMDTLPPVTTPVGLTNAAEIELLVHNPPATESNSGIEAPEQTCEGPVIIEGSGFTVTTTDLEQPPTV
jgi:hypothetical protein